MLFQNRNIVNARYKGNDMYDVNLMGVDEAYANGGQVDIHRGRFIAEQESQRRMPVVVIGADIEKGLFGAIDPIGKTINVDGHQFEVIGTMLRPSASFFGDTDNRILLPYGAMQKMYPNARENAIVVTAKRRADAAADETVKGQVAAALRSDPYFYDEHVTVTINNGVVTLQGMVFDDWDLRNAMRIARKIPGVKRVVNDLEIKLGGE